MRVGLKSTSFTGNWYLSVVSFVGIYLLNSVNENGLRKLDLRPCTNNSTDDDLVPHLITLSGTSYPENVQNTHFLTFLTGLSL